MVSACGIETGKYGIMTGVGTGEYGIRTGEYGIRTGLGLGSIGLGLGSMGSGLVSMGSGLGAGELSNKLASYCRFLYMSLDKNMLTEEHIFGGGVFDSIITCTCTGS